MNPTTDRPIERPTLMSRLAEDRRRAAAGREMLEARKQDLIAAIRQHNATAKPKFLSRFSAGSLREYLDHLNEVRRKRLKAAHDGLAPQTSDEPAYRHAS